MRGIDISNWQSDITIKNVERDIDFCIVKATEGIGYVSPSCDRQVQQCKAEGILWGFYHFARENEPEAEAEYFYNECMNYFNCGIPVLDYETSNYNNREWCERFMTRLHDLSGVWAVLYISASRCSEYEGSWIPEKCGLWVAGYPYAAKTWTDDEMPYNITPWEFAAIWQFTSSLRLTGYNGNLDANIAYMDASAWAKYANAHEQPNPTHHDMSLDDLVRDTLKGAYGNDDERKRLLGDDYQRVQDRINALYRIANEVIDGKWGNGWNREQSLNGAGYPYDIVQSIVNDILN